MDQKIIFTNISGYPDLEKPILASKEIPSWYSELNSYLAHKND
jgi:hypothetical protein